MICCQRALDYLPVCVDGILLKLTTHISAPFPSKRHFRYTMDYGYMGGLNFGLFGGPCLELYRFRGMKLIFDHASANVAHFFFQTSQMQKKFVWNFPKLIDLLANSQKRDRTTRASSELIISIDETTPKVCTGDQNLCSKRKIYSLTKLLILSWLHSETFLGVVGINLH